MRAEEIRIRRDELNARLKAVDDAIGDVRGAGAVAESTASDRIVSSELENLQDQRDQLLKEIAALEMPEAPRS